MSTTYGIKVINNNSDSTRYLLFCDLPEASDNIGKAWVNVYTKTPGVTPNGGSTNLTITDTVYAVCGMAAEQLGPGVSVSNTASTKVVLGPNTQGLVKVDIIEDGLQFVSPVGTTTVVGGYEIDCGTWTNAQYPNAYVGVGRIQPNKSPQTIIPTATWRAKSTQAYKVYPKKIFFISTGDYAAGNIVDVATFGNVATIDFTGLKQHYATVIQNDNGTFSPTTYDFNP